MLQLQQIDKSFGKLRVLKNVTVTFSAGQSVAIIGPNGSGKTTLIKAILGMVRPDAGHILFRSRRIDGQSEYRAAIGYMPQIGRYPENMKIGQLFDMMRDLRQTPGQRLDEELIEAYRLPDLYHKPMRTLSGGTRQKVSAALAFLFDPAVMILDEPTAGLDPLSAEILKDKVSRGICSNKLFLITSHILSDLEELTSEVLYLSDGELVFFKPLEELRQETGEMRLGRAIARIMAARTPEKSLQR